MDKRGNWDTIIRHNTLNYHPQALGHPHFLTFITIHPIHLSSQDCSNLINQLNKALSIEITHTNYDPSICADSHIVWDFAATILTKECALKQNGNQVRKETRVITYNATQRLTLDEDYLFGLEKNKLEPRSAPILAGPDLGSSFFYEADIGSRMAPYLGPDATGADSLLLNITYGNTTFNATETISEAEREAEKVKWVVICTVCMLFGLFLATCQYLVDKRNRPENVKKRKLQALADRKKKEEKAIAAIKKEPIQVDQFLQKLRQKKLDKYLNFEVRAIVRNQEEFPCTVAVTPENAAKNVSQDVTSYDHSLVRLEDIPPGEDSDYINASYIEGYNGEIEYIATQGPKGKSVAAFWQLVWQENVHCIVMATGLFENAVQQCDKYWGDLFSAQPYIRQGNIHIYLKEKLELAKLVIRTFHISQDGCEQYRVVKHFEMCGFSEDFTDPGFLLDVRRRVHQHMDNQPGPILVHCRCGGGRTAVFITIDYCLKQLEAEKFVDIYSTVLHLRKFRQNMVRSLTQYSLIYDTLAMYVQVWSTVIPSAQLPAATQKLMLKDAQSNVIGYEKEFQTLQEIVPKILTGDCASGHRDENRKKSRDIMLLPPERARPYLQTMETNDAGTDFINAVFVDGYLEDNSFIITQWPMHSTINDIWRLLYDFKINSLVLLNDNKCNRSTPCFWPKVLDEEVKYGPIGVKYLGCQKYPHIIIRAFSIRKKASGLPLIDLLTKSSESVVVKMFHYTSWNHQDKIPTSTKSFLYMMGCVDEWQEKMKSTKPVCIMSKDGYSRSGIYSTLSFCCDQLHREQEVDIFNAVRIVKKNRPQLIPTLEEYIYCYTYMALVISIMQEDTPKLLVTTPTVIEGEIQQGYELVTGFENILSSSPSDELNYSFQGTSHKNHHHSNALQDQSDSRSSSCNGLHNVDTHVTAYSENNNQPVNSKHRGPSRGRLKHVRHSTGHLRENGYLVENDNKNAQIRKDVKAPAAPGHIWSPPTFPSLDRSSSYGNDPYEYYPNVDDSYGNDSYGTTSYGNNLNGKGSYGNKSYGNSSNANGSYSMHGNYGLYGNSSYANSSYKNGNYDFHSSLGNSSNYGNGSYGNGPQWTGSYVSHGQSMKRKPLFRQNAEEMMDLSPDYSYGPRSKAEPVTTSFL